MKQWLKRIAAVGIAAALVILLFPGETKQVYAQQWTISGTVRFQNQADTAEGHVNYSLDGGQTWTAFAPTGDTATLASTQCDDANGGFRLQIVPENGYSIDWTATTLSLDGGAATALAGTTDNGGIAFELMGPGGYTVPSGTTSFSLEGVEFNQGQAPGPGGGGGQPLGNTNATIEVLPCTPTASWTGQPSTGHEVITVGFDKMYCTVSVGINGSWQQTQSDNYEPESGRYETGTTPRPEAVGQQHITYDREATDQTVDLDLFLRNFGSQIYKLEIDNHDGHGRVDYTDQLMVDTDGDTVGDTSLYRDRYSFLTHFHNQGMEVTIEDVPVSPTEEYDVYVDVAPNEVCHIGNFLWSTDDYYGPDGTKPDDRYIGHSRLTLLSVDFNDGDPNWDFDANGLKHVDIAEVEDGVEYNATFNGQELPYIHYQLERSGPQFSESENGEIARNSDMVIPDGSWVTMKIETLYGYQVKGFGVNGEDVNLGDGQSIFSFRVGKGNYHISADISEAQDDARVDSEAVSDAGVILEEGTLDAGTARLFVADSIVSAKKRAEFADKAAAAGVDIQSIVDMSLDQVFYMGTGNDDDVWINEMHDLAKPAMIYLEIPGAKGEAVSLLHNIHDGDEYEMIEGEYTPQFGENVYGFPVSGFSSFAIVKDAKKSADTPAANKAPGTEDTPAANKAPRTGDAASPARAVLILGLAALGVVLTSKKVRK